MILVCRKDKAILDLNHAIVVRIAEYAQECYIDIDFTTWINRRIKVGKLSDEEKDSLLAFIALYKNKETVFELEDVIRKIKRDRGKDHDTTTRSNEKVGRGV